VSCATTGEPPTITDRQGLAEVHVNGAQLLATGITRVTLAAAGQTQDLTFNPATGTFDGSLILSSGPQTLVARAFSGDTLVGQSQPTSVDVQSGAVTRVMLRILDLTTNTPVYGPIVDSLSFPTTTQATAQVTFAISVVAPTGDPVTYSWTSDCADATFSAPGAATTSWSKPTEGTCAITVTATSNGFTVAQSFGIVVFSLGSSSGGVSVNSVFVSAPAMALSFPDVNCSSFPGSNASCTTTIASPSTTGYGVGVSNWGSFSTAGTLELSDNCGGRFGTSFRQVGFVSGNWLPPVGSGLCIFTARAVNGDGVASTLSAAILVHAGSAPAPTQPPSIFGHFFYNSTAFSLGDASSPTNAGQIPVGASVFVDGFVDFRDGLPGTLAITDDCAGAQPDPLVQNSFPKFFESAPWSVPDLPGRTCTVTIQVTNLQGVTGNTVAGQYVITSP
jgi:hypothetical protein